MGRTVLAWLLEAGEHLEARRRAEQRCGEGDGHSGYCAKQLEEGQPTLDCVKLLSGCRCTSFSEPFLWWRWLKATAGLPSHLTRAGRHHRGKEISGKAENDLTELPAYPEATICDGCGGHALAGCYFCLLDVQGNRQASLMPCLSHPHFLNELSDSNFPFRAHFAYLFWSCESPSPTNWLRRREAPSRGRRPSLVHHRELGHDGSQEGSLAGEVSLEHKSFRRASLVSSHKMTRVISLNYTNGPISVLLSLFNN